MVLENSRVHLEFRALLLVETIDELQILTLLLRRE